MSTSASAADSAGSVPNSPALPAAGPAHPAPGHPHGAAPAWPHQQLVQACLASEPGAWDEFVARFAGLLRHVVNRTCSQHRLPLPAADRDDIVAEILVEILRNDAAVLRAFAGRASLPTYLAVVARRVAVRSLQRDRSRRTVEDEGIQPADRHDAIGALADREAVEKLLEALDETEARLVRLHHIEARSYGEISRLTGLPMGSIGPALSQARRKLRDRAGGDAHPP